MKFPRLPGGISARESYPVSNGEPSAGGSRATKTMSATMKMSEKFWYLVPIWLVGRERKERKLTEFARKRNRLRGKLVPSSGSNHLDATRGQTRKKTYDNRDRQSRADGVQKWLESVADQIVEHCAKHSSGSLHPAGSTSPERPCSVACPVCGSAARWRHREQQDNELNTVYAYLECPGCGLRSREIVSLKPEHETLEAEWPRTQSRSQFSRMLASDPDMAARSLEVAKAVREAGSEEVQAIERSERLTPADLAIVINARADND